MNQEQKAVSHSAIKKEMPPPGIFNWIIWIPRRILRGCIVIYQKTLSLDHGPMSHLVPFPVCKYHPTCSEYGYQAISRFGVLKGIPLTIWRIVRCNPWSEGGEDPIPNGEKQVDKFKAEDAESPDVSSGK